MEPTAEELQSFKTVEDICNWAELGDSTDEDTNPRKTFLSSLGAKPTTKVRTLSAIPESAWDAAISSWKVGDAAPSAVLLASAGLVWTAARLAAGVVQTRSQREATAAAEARHLEIKHEIAKLQASQPQAPSAASASGQIKLSTVVDQGIPTDRDITPLTESEVTSCYDVYRAKMGHDPRPDEDITEEQLAGLRALFASGAAPYVDLAIWGPYGRRTQRKLKFSGLVLGAGGLLHHIQLPGPPNLESWQAGFSVFCTGCIMLQVISVATLELWDKMIEEYSVRYGPSVWALLYQTEVRARSELVMRTKRAGQTALDQAKAAGGTHPFNPKSPWDWVLRTAAQDAQFWRKELEEPALLILTHVANLSEQVDGDAITDHQPPAKKPRELARAFAPPPPPATKNFVRVHRQRDGLMTHNRRDFALCPDFQKGECGEMLRDCVCPRNPALRHQCAKCLLPGHGANRCGEPKAATPPGTKGSSKGRGKGHGKGGKGRRQWQY